MALKRASEARPSGQERARGVGGRGDCEQVCPVRGDEAVPSADLGGSSNYSNEIFED